MEDHNQMPVMPNSPEPEKKRFPNPRKDNKKVLFSLLNIIIILILLLLVLVMNALYWNPVEVDQDRDELEEELEYLASDVVFSDNIQSTSPFTRILGDIDFNKREDRGWVTYLSSTRDKREELRSQACFSFNSIVNDKNYPQPVDPSSFTDEDKAEISELVSGFVVNDEQFYDRMGATIKAQGYSGVMEICAGETQNYLIAMKGSEIGGSEMTVFEIVNTESGIYFKNLMSVHVVYSSYLFIPDYIEGLPAFVSAFGDAGLEAWKYYVFDEVAEEKMLVESCTVDHGNGIQQTSAIQTCTREYKPEE